MHESETRGAQMLGMRTMVRLSFQEEEEEEITLKAWL
jgi:hypothetical protein